jgi:YidC/Oxa1 family membrane protein insertase
MVPFAANPLQPLIDVFKAVLVFFHDNVGLGWGFSIVVLTIIIRALLLPLALKQFRSMQSLARHQPEMKQLQEKYKGDKDRLNQEMMKFYRENKINPLASCFPLLAQIPVFISLFYMLRTDLRHEICPDINPAGISNPKPCGETPDSQFFFIPDLTNKATGAVLVTLIVLYVGSQLISTVMSTVSSDRNQKLIMYALPFFFVTFVINFPAGLLVYWITTNLWTIVQQMIIRRRLGPMRPPPDPNAPKETGGGGLLASLGLPSASREPATAGATSSASGSGARSGSNKSSRPTGPPPSPPRKKKKRSGRRR